MVNWETLNPCPVRPRRGSRSLCLAATLARSMTSPQRSVSVKKEEYGWEAPAEWVKGTGLSEDFGLWGTKAVVSEWASGAFWAAPGGGLWGLWFPSTVLLIATPCSHTSLLVWTKKCIWWPVPLPYRISGLEGTWVQILRFLDEECESWEVKWHAKVTEEMMVSQSQSPALWLSGPCFPLMWLYHGCEPSEGGGQQAGRNCGSVCTSPWMLFWKPRRRCPTSLASTSGFQVGEDLPGAIQGSESGKGAALPLGLFF